MLFNTKLTQKVIQLYDIFCNFAAFLRVIYYSSLQIK